MLRLNTELLAELLPVIEEGWDEPVDRIESAQIQDDGSIIAIAYSGDLPLAVKIDDEEIEVRPIEDDDDDDEEVETEFQQADIDLDDVAAQFAASPKQKKCVKGIPCKGQCISAKKTCRQPLSPTQQQLKSKIPPSSDNENATN